MATPASRSDLKTYALRKLGAPVISINVDDSQLEDRIDDALNLWTQFAVDGTNKTYVAMNVTSNVLSNGYFTMDPSIINVTRIFPILGSVTGSSGPQNFNIFDLNYQLRLNELYDFTSADYVYFELAQQHIRTLELLFVGEPPIRFNRYDGKLYVDGIKKRTSNGTVVVAECYQVLPANNTLFWNDVWLKKYVTCLFQEQWGSNLRKFKGTQLPGGVQLDGQSILDEAIVEKLRLEAELRSMYEEPIRFLIG